MRIDDRLNFQKKTIIDIFEEYADYPHLPDGIRYENVIDEKNNRFQLVRLGWGKKGRVYSVIFHVDIINQKIWIQQDNTEVAIANLLTEKGVAKQDIVLGYFSETRRQHSEYAVS